MNFIMFAQNSRFPEPEFGNSVENPRFKTTNRFLFHGIAASILLTTAYFMIVSVVESFDHAVTTFAQLAYLFLPLIVSFGVQISLFSYARQLSKVTHQRSANVTTSGGMSTASMILCCAHHLTDVAAFVGLTAVTLFLTTYQPVFLLIGIVSNVLGILTVLLFLQKKVLCYRQGFLTPLMRLNLSKIRKIAAIIAVIVVILAFVFVALNYQSNAQANSGNPSRSSNGITFNLPSEEVNQNGLTIQATPQPFKYGEPIKISLALNTHSGALSYDLTQLVTLQDSNGTTYTPTAWDRPAPEGHHASGTLDFPPTNGQPSSIQLVLRNVYGADWNFEWTLNQFVSFIIR